MARSSSPPATARPARDRAPTVAWTAPANAPLIPTALRGMLDEEDLLTAPPLTVMQRVTPALFATHGLDSLLQEVFGGQVPAAIERVRPDLVQIRPSPTPSDFWQGEAGIPRAEGATAQMLDTLGLRGAVPADLLPAATPAVFAWCGLGEMLDIVYGGEPRGALRPHTADLPWWQLPPVPSGWWRGDLGRSHARAATRRLLADRGWAGLPPEAIARRVDIHVFRAHRLDGMLQTVYAGSPYQALRDLFPALPPWAMSRVPRALWTGPDGPATARAALEWLLAQKGWTEASAAELAERLTPADFVAAGLQGCYIHGFGSSLYRAIQAVRPAMQPWEMPRVTHGFWRRDTDRAQARRATRWLLDQLGLPDPLPHRLAARLTAAQFEAVGLLGLLKRCYHSSPWQALADLDPTLQPWQMDKPPNGLWQGAAGREQARAATRWLLARLGLSGEATLEAGLVRRADFGRAGLAHMLHQCYADDPSAALAEAGVMVLPPAPDSPAHKHLRQRVQALVTAQAALEAELEAADRVRYPALYATQTSRAGS